MLLVAIGIFQYFKRNVMAGTILMLIGGFFILPRLISTFPSVFGMIPSDFSHQFWPLILIAAGILIILDKFNRRKRVERIWENVASQTTSEAYSSNTYKGTMSKNSIFGSAEHIIIESEFKGAELNAVFGALSLDLRKTSLPVGETKLDMNAVFGSITVLVPKEWFVETQVDIVFGGFEDQRILVETSDHTRKLIITGSCLFGGGELKS
jgi:predicted membrane protein